MRRPGEKSNLRFQTSEQTKNTRRRRTALLFLILLLAIAAASTFAILKETGWAQKREEQTVNKTNMKSEVDLLIGGATTEGNLVFLATIEMNTGNSSFKVRAYDPHVSYEGKTFQEIYGGEDADMISEEHFIKCFAKKYNTNVDKFVIVKEPNAANIMFCLGAPTVNIPQDVDYSGNDFSLHLMEGDQTLGGAEFFNYLRWLGRQDKSSAYKAQANVLADLIDQSLNESNAEAGQSIFETLSDQVDTDISINDFARYADFLAGLSEPSNRTITAD